VLSIYSAPISLVLLVTLLLPEVRKHA